MFPQNNTQSGPEHLSLLDSVKYFYGDPCFIGVESKLIRRLYLFEEFQEVRNYLDQYESLKQKIIDFRLAYEDMIENDESFILDISRVLFEDEINIVNAVGIYLGPEKVNRLSLSYMLIRASVGLFFQPLIRFVNFDRTFRKELEHHPEDWFKSEKLRELPDLPFINY